MAAGLILPPAGTGRSEYTVRIRNHIVTGVYYVYYGQSKIFDEAHLVLPLGSQPHVYQTKTVNGVDYCRYDTWDVLIKSGNLRMCAMGKSNYKLAITSVQSWPLRNPMTGSVIYAIDYIPNHSITDNGTETNGILFGQDEWYSILNERRTQNNGESPFFATSGGDIQPRSALLLTARGAPSDDELFFEEEPFAPGYYEDETYYEDSFFAYMLPRPITGILNAELVIRQNFTTWHEVTDDAVSD